MAEKHITEFPAEGVRVDYVFTVQAGKITSSASTCPSCLREKQGMFTGSILPTAGFMNKGFGRLASRSGSRRQASKIIQRNLFHSKNTLRKTGDTELNYLKLN